MSWGGGPAKELPGKYRGCVRRALSPEQVERSIALLEDVEKVDDVRALVDALIAMTEGS